jgi:hypothetical protein
MRRRLTPEERNEIRSLMREGVPRTEIATQFGISSTHVYKLSRGRHETSADGAESALPVGIRIEYKAAGQLLVRIASKSATRALFTVGTEVFDEVARSMRHGSAIARAAFNERALQETAERCVRLVRRWQGAEQLKLDVLVVTAPPTTTQTISPSWVLYLLLRDALRGSQIRVLRQTTGEIDDSDEVDAEYRRLLATLDEVTNVGDD